LLYRLCTSGSVIFLRYRFHTENCYVMWNTSLQLIQ
jgi:hypothetical protein